MLQTSEFAKLRGDLRAAQLTKKIILVGKGGTTNPTNRTNSEPKNWQIRFVGFVRFVVNRLFHSACSEVNDWISYVFGSAEPGQLFRYEFAFRVGDISAV